MRPARDRVAVELGQTQIGPFAFPVVANVDAEPNADPGRVAGLLAQQIDAPVQWVRTIERLANEGVTAALEIGPGKVLAGLVKRIDKRVRVLSVNDAEGVEKADAFLRGEA